MAAIVAAVAAAIVTVGRYRVMLGTARIHVYKRGPYSVAVEVQARIAGTSDSYATINALHVDVEPIQWRDLINPITRSYELPKLKTNSQRINAAVAKAQRMADEFNKPL